MDSSALVSLNLDNSQKLQKFTAYMRVTIATEFAWFLERFDKTTLSQEKQQMFDAMKQEFSTCILKLSNGMYQELNAKGISNFSKKWKEVMPEISFIADVSVQLEQLTFSKPVTFGKKWPRLFVFMHEKHAPETPSFVSFMSRPRVSSSMSRSCNKEMVDKIFAVVNSGVKAIDVDAKLLEQEKRAGFIHAMSSISDSCNVKPFLIKCSLPVVDILVNAAKQYKEIATEESYKKFLEDSREIIRFIMIVERYSHEFPLPKTEESNTDYIRHKCFPFKKIDEITATTIGFNAREHGKDEIYKGNFGYEPNRRYNLVIFESIILACYFAQNSLFGNANELDAEQKLLTECLLYTLHCGDIENSLVYALPIAFKFVAFTTEFKFFDSLATFDCISTVMNRPQFNYPDLYGTTTGINLLTHSPKFTFINDEIAEKVWSKKNIKGFQHIFFDNNTELAMQNENAKKIINGYTECMDFVAKIPKILCEEDVPSRSFDEVLHIILKTMIGYPSHFAFLDMIYTRKGPVFKSSKVFEMETPVSMQKQQKEVSNDTYMCFKFVKCGEKNEYEEVFPFNCPEECIESDDEDNADDADDVDQEEWTYTYEECEYEYECNDN